MGLKEQMAADLENVFLSDEWAEAVIIYPRAGAGAYGYEFGAAIETTAAVELAFKRVINSKGESVTASLIGTFRLATGIKIDDELVYNGKRYIVIAANPDPAAIEVYATGVKR